MPDIFDQAEDRHIASVGSGQLDAENDALRKAVQGRVQQQQQQGIIKAPAASPTQEQEVDRIKNEAVQTVSAKLPDKAAPSPDNPDMGKTDKTVELQAPIEGMSKGAAVGLLKGAQNLWNTMAQGVNFADTSVFQGKGIVPETKFADQIPVSDDVATKGGMLAAQYVAPMLLGSGVAGVASKGATAMAKVFSGVATGALTAATMDPDQERLSDTLIKNYPWMRGTVADFLAAKPGDTEATKRLKNVGEAVTMGAGLGAAFSGAVGVSKWARAAMGKDPAMSAHLEEFAQTLPKNANADDILQHLQSSAQEAAAGGEAGASVTAGQGSMHLVPSTPEEAKASAQKAVDSIMSPNTEKNPGMLNMATLSGSNNDLIKDAASEIVSGLQEKMAAGRTGSISWDEMTQSGVAYLNSRPEDFASLLKNHVPGTAYSNEEFSAIKVFAQASMQKLIDMNAEAAALKAKHFSEYTEADHQLLSAVQRQKDVIGTVFPVFTGAKQVPGQQLAFLQAEIPALERGAKGLDAVTQHLRLSGGPDQVMQNAERLSQAIEAGGNPDLAKVGIMNMAGKVAGGFEQAVTETALSGMVSNPRTSMRIAVSSFVQNGIVEMQRANLALFGKQLGLTDPQLEQARTAFWARFTGMKGSMMEAFGAAADTLKNGKSPVSSFNFAPAQWKQDLSEKAAALNWSDNMAKKFIFTAADTAAKAQTKIVDYSSRGVHAAESMSAAFARRQSYLEDSALEALSHGLNKADAEKYVYARSLNPSESMIAKADQAGAEASMTASYEQLLGDSRTGRVAQNVDKTISSIPFGKIITPFMKVGVNEIVQSIETTPLVGMLSPRVRGMMQAGGAERAKAISRMMVGGEIIGALGALDASGVVSFTGTQPENHELARALKDHDASYQPDSVKIGNSYYSAQPLGTFGRLMGAYADLREFSKTGSPEDTKRYGHLLMSMTAEYFTPKQMTQDIPEALDKMTKLIHGGEAGDFAAFASEFGARLQPASGFTKFMRDMTDPLQREVKDQQDPWQTFRNTLKNQIPGMSAALPPQRNIFAEVVHDPHYFGSDAISPFMSSGDPGQDKVSSELMRLGLWNRQFLQKPDGDTSLDIKMPGRTLGFNVPGDQSKIMGRVPIQLSPQEYDMFVQYAAGTRAPKGLMDTSTLAAADWGPGERDKFLREHTTNGNPHTLKAELGNIFDHPQRFYGGLGPNATQDQKDQRLQWAVKDIVDLYRKNATSAIYSDLQVQAQIKKGIMDRTRALGGNVSVGGQ